MQNASGLSLNTMPATLISQPRSNSLENLKLSDIIGNKKTNLPKRTKSPKNSPKNLGERDIVDQISFKTRTGFIPQMHKVNQDSYLILKEFAGIPKLWMIGVMDGHGANGHNVSQFVKQ